MWLEAGVLHALLHGRLLLFQGVAGRLLLFQGVAGRQSCPALSRKARDIMNALQYALF
jgi:hypothetical protein